ncbi:MAG: apolipoprotein N-acyltransferase [Methylococcales bacterium]|nr:apolipoprotein N-acyltransferase [Methylococcales bacterium]
MTELLHWKWEFAAPFMGILLTLAFAPYDAAYAALPALMFLYGSWSKLPPPRAMLCAYLFGLGLFGSGIWWVYISLHDFGGADALSAALLTLLLVGVWAVFPALTAGLTAPVLRSKQIAVRLTAAALLWVAVEYFRGYWLLNGFPWLQIGYSQLTTPLAGYAPVSGVYGVGFVLALSAFAGVEMLSGRLKLLPGLTCLLLVWAGGGLLRQHEWTTAIGEPFKVTLVQGNINQAQKWLPSQKDSTLQLYRQLTEQHWDSRVIIWPETAIPAFLSQVREFYLEPLTAVARAHHADLVVSLPTGGDGKAYFNSVLALGENSAFYHKNHLLPFGEYLPLQPLSGWILDLISIPLGDFSAGEDRQSLLRAGGYPFTTTICYEDAFGEQVIRQIDQAAYIVNVTNDAWFGDSSQPYQHMQMAQMRALETGRYLARATNTGMTGFIRPDGAISSQAPLFTTTTLTDSITPMAGLTPYARMGDNTVFAGFSGLVLLLYLAGGLFKNRN